MLYESEFESQMWMLYNSCKQLMAVGDAYPSKVNKKYHYYNMTYFFIQFSWKKNNLKLTSNFLLQYSVKLEKGDYILRLNIRHENKALLEKLQDLPATIQQRLQQPITLDVYCSQPMVILIHMHYVINTLNIG